MKLYRIGDRSLARLLAGSQFLRQLDNYDIARRGRSAGRAGLAGRARDRRQLNKEVTTSFPVDEALPERKPGVYVLTANAADDQWRRLGFGRHANGSSSPTSASSTYTGDRTGSTSLPARWAPPSRSASVSCTLLAKNNEMLGTAKTDTDGRAIFTAGLMRGDGGMVPAVLIAKRRDRRLRLPRHGPGRLRPVRPRRCRPRRAGRARRLCLDRTRHLPRRRDCACRSPGARQRRPRRSRTCR